MTRAAFISRDSQFPFLARHAPALLSLCHATAARLLATRTLFYGLLHSQQKRRESERAGSAAADGCTRVGRLCSPLR